MTVCRLTLHAFYSLGDEERNLTQILRKECLDIAMWAGFDPENHQKNLDYFNEWQIHFLASAGCGDPTRNNIYNMYEVRLCQAVIHSLTA